LPWILVEIHDRESLFFLIPVKIELKFVFLLTLIGLLPRADSADRRLPSRSSASATTRS
jgi:hypothetical protein